MEIIPLARLMHHPPPMRAARHILPGADYTAVFGPAGSVAQAKEGFIAARFSPSQPLRIKRATGLRALQSVALPEPSNLFAYILPWEPERLAAEATAKRRWSCRG
jgi:hypothetical protein